MKKTLEAFGELLTIMNRLRAECPWDKEQTFETLRKLTIEETYELADAILKNDIADIKDELGDLLLHIVFYSKIASERGDFDILDVIETIKQKLVYRHPHIFGDVEVSNADEVKQNWEELKLQQGKRTVLGGVPKSLPALIKANRIQEKVRGVGFDWEVKEQIWEKLDEEVAELQMEIKKIKGIPVTSPESYQQIEEEFGDLFFTIINAARLYGIDPENALEKTNIKFMERFNYLERTAHQNGKTLKELSMDEMDTLWEEAKKVLNKPLP